MKLHPRATISPVRRRLFTVASVLSLLPCMAAMALWIESYWRWEAIIWHPSAPLVRLDSAAGELCVCGAPNSVGFNVFPGDELNRLGGKSSEAKIWLSAELTHQRFAWFGFAYVVNRQSIWKVSLYFPHWSVACFFGFLPMALGLWTIRSHRRISPTACTSCGYDLRASELRCPECGMAFFTPDSGPTG